MAKTTVPGAYIADNAVVSAKIASNAIEASHISGGAVVSVDIGDNSITISKIAANAVSTSEIAANAIGSSEIAANAVDSAEIVSGSIDTTHIADSQVTNAKLANSSVTVNSNSLSLGASLTLDTDDIGEGSSNLYHTTARVNSAFDTRLGTKDTGDLSEGSNLYHTTERVQDVTGAQLVTNGSHTGISFSYDDANDGAIDATVSLSGFNTDALSEGSSNLYFTNARAQGALTAGTGIGISSGTISIGQSVATNASPTFDSLTLTGALNITGDINSYNVTDLDVVDKTITLGVGQTDANSDGSGIVIDGSSASLLWDETNDQWDFNKGVEITGVLKIPCTSDFEIELTGSVPGNIRALQDFFLLSQNGNLHLGSGGTNSQLSILGATGNVQIGATGTVDDWRLNVESSDVYAASFDTSNDVGIVINGNNSTASQIIGYSQSAGTYNDIEIRASSGVGTGIYIDGSETRVGIGSVSPTAKLQIGHNPAHTTGNITSNIPNLELFNNLEANTDEKGAVLTFSDNYYDGTNYNRTTRAAIKGGTDVIGNDARGYLAFYTNSASAFQLQEKARFNNEGLLGIGTSSPLYSIHTSDAIDNSDNDRRRILIESTANGPNMGYMWKGPSSNGTARAGGIYYQPGDTDNETYVGITATNSAYQMVIARDGRVGIGTNSPNTVVGKVDIAASASNYNTAPMITFRDTAGATDSRNWSIGNLAINYGDFHIGCGDSNSDYFDAPSHSKFMIDKDGQVGIGTVDPAFRLHAYHPTSNVVARFESGDSQVWIDLHDPNSGNYGCLLGHDSSNLFMITDANVTKRLVILNNSYNVGISVDNPSEKLEVDGGVKISNANSRLYFGTEGGTSYRALEGNTGGSLLQIGEGYTKTVLQSSKVGIGAADSGNQLAVIETNNYSPPGLGSNGAHFGVLKKDSVATGDYGYLLGVTSSGHVWQQAQRVDGTATAYDMHLQPSGGNVTIGGTSAGPSNGSLGPTLTIQSESYGVDVALVLEADTGEFTLYSYNNKFHIAETKTSGTFNYLTTLDHNGNYGIGTTSPDKKFHVKGDARFGDTTTTSAASYSITKDARRTGERGPNPLSWDVLDRSTSAADNNSPISSFNSAYGVSFSPNGGSTTNHWILAEGPGGGIEWIWKGASTNTANSGGQGGWDCGSIGIDSAYPYMLVNFVKRFSSTATGTYYFGTSNIYRSDTSTALSNPYMTITGTNNLPQGVWCADIHYIVPYGYTGNVATQNRGLWRMDTGASIQLWSGQFSGVNQYRSYPSHTTTHSIGFRTYLYYATANDGTTLYWGQPAIYKCDGTQPTLAEIRGDNVNSNTSV